MHPEAMIATQIAAVRHGTRLHGCKLTKFTGKVLSRSSTACSKMAEREVRSINDQTKVARFPVHRDLVGFEFHESTVNEALVTCIADFTHNVVLIGGPGTGKTHLATIGLQAIVHQHRP